MNIDQKMLDQKRFKDWTMNASKLSESEHLYPYQKKLVDECMEGLRLLVVEAANKMSGKEYK